MKELSKSLIKQSKTDLDHVKAEVGKVVVGQEKTVSALIKALLANGHVLLEGIPGIAKTLAIKALAKSSGVSDKELVNKWKKLGDLGLVAEEVMKNKKQNTLFSQELTTKKVLDNLRKLPELIGNGTQSQKLALISELLTSAHSLEAKYIVRTLIGDLRIGVASGTLRDSIVDQAFKPKSMEEKKELMKIVQNAYDKATDIAVVFEKLKELRKSINDQKTPSNIEEVKSVIKTVVDDVLGIWPQENAGGNEELTKGLVELLIEIRKEARENKNFALSDKVRDDLKELGVQLMDGKEGTSFEID